MNPREEFELEQRMSLEMAELEPELAPANTGRKKLQLTSKSVGPERAARTGRLADGPDGTRGFRMKRKPDRRWTGNVAGKRCSLDLAT